MASLKSRLGRFKTFGLTKASELGKPVSRLGGSSPGIMAFPVSDVCPDAAGACIGEGPSESFSLAGWTALGQGAFTRTISTGLVLSESTSGGFCPADFERAKNILPGSNEPIRDIRELAFFDLETTGLSGGTGTIAFLAALGCFEGRDFLLTQVFIEDYPGESLFLKSIASYLALHPWAVTYNGASFDMPLIRTRFIMNGEMMPETRHTDLLKPARRLWRRSIGPCSLKAVESAVLGFEREEDVPGFLIPRIWLEYSAGGKRRTREGFASLLKVFEHNAQDVVSLARLFLKIRKIMGQPLEAAYANRVHAPSLAHELMDRGRHGEALDLLEAQGADGDQASLHLLASVYRKSARWMDHRRVVEAMDARTVSGCLAKAKLAEHRIGDYAAALAWAGKALVLVGQSSGTLPEEKLAAQALALERRMARLRRRLDAGKGMKSPEGETGESSRP